MFWLVLKLFFWCFQLWPPSLLLLTFRLQKFSPSCFCLWYCWCSSSWTWCCVAFTGVGEVSSPHPQPSSGFHGDLMFRWFLCAGQILKQTYSNQRSSNDYPENHYKDNLNLVKVGPAPLQTDGESPNVPLRLSALNTNISGLLLCYNLIWLMHSDDQLLSFCVFVSKSPVQLQDSVEPD